MVTQPNEPTAVTPSEAGNPPTDPSNPKHLDVVYSLIAELDKFSAAVPDITSGDHQVIVKFVRGHLNIPDPFLDKAAATLEQSTAIQGTQLFEPADNRDRLERYQAFKLLVDKLNGVLNTVQYTVWAQKSALATDALRIYGISKQIMLKPGNIAIVQHVVNMKQELGRKGPRKQQQPQPTDPTTPDAPNTPTPQQPQQPAAGQPS